MQCFYSYFGYYCEEWIVRPIWLIFTIFVAPYNFFKYLKDFDTFLRENPDIPSIQLSYERLSNAPREEVKRLAEFIGILASNEKIAETVDICRFDNMKNADANFKDQLKRPPTERKTPRETYRKGKLFFQFLPSERV